MKEEKKYIKGIELGKTKIFNIEQEKFIINNYEHMSNKEIATVINSTDDRVRGYANARKLIKSYNPTRFEDWQKEYIHKWYNKKPTGEIAKKINLTTKQVNDYGYRHIGHRDLVRYIVNEDYFKSIDTEDKAYWLGFLYADGCINEDKTRGYVKSMNMELGLAIVDVEHLKKLNKHTNSNYKIKNKTVNLNGNKYKACRVIICNTNFCRNLIDKGCVPNKSLILTMPNQEILDRSLIRHFIRGYFDGDGCVYFNESGSHNTKCSIGFVGTQSILNGIQDVLSQELMFTKTKLFNKGKAFQCQWAGTNNCTKFYEYIYKDATVWLDRKYDKFQKIIKGVD